MLLMIHKPRPTVGDRALAGLSRAAATAFTAIDAVVMWPFRAAESRRLVETLSAMSDHDLRDIGLTRHDLRDTLALPLDRDAGDFLADRRASRRLQP